MNFEPEIIFEDNHLIVINKPINILTQSDKTGDLDLLTLLKDYIKIRDNKPGNVFLGMVHRLDRVVSGLIVFAKTSKAASRLSEQIRTHQFHKTYIAHILGNLNSDNKKLVHYLKKDMKSNKSEAVNKPTSGYKKAELILQILKYDKGNTMVEIKLISGRSHQIRCQLSHIGHPIVGDTKYGFKYMNHTKHKIRGIHLCSTKLLFKHPTLNSDLEFSLIPDWFSV